MATHSSTLACKIPWTEEPGGLQSMELQESDTTQHAHTIVSLYFVAQGDVCPGKSTAVKGPSFQSVSYTLLLRIQR